MTPDEFRALLPAFADVERFPDAQLQFWLDFALKSCPEQRWGDWRPQGVMFLAAHHLTLLAAASKGSDGAGGMEAAAGPVVSESKTVGSVSKSISRAGAAATADVRGGQYNDTVWGKQYWSLASIVGAGGMVV